MLYTLGQWREIIAYFRHRQARYGAIATVGVLVALAITVAVNYLGARQNKRWDLTASRQNSLAEQTVKVLQSLDAPVKFTVFAQQTDFERFRTRLDAYAYSSPRVNVEYIDPDMKPVEARAAGIEAYGTVVVTYKEKTERVTTDTEQDLTNALIKAMSTMERKVYYLQGHGEREPNKTERDGYSAVSGSLRRDNYMVERLVLAQMKEVPDDATVVLIAGPTSDILPAEADALRRYLARAGKLMVMLDPPIGANAAPLPNLEAILKEWGVTPGNNVVVDISGATNDPSIAVAATYPLHAITERFSTLTIYPLARGIEPIEGGTNGRVAQDCGNHARQLGRVEPGVAQRRFRRLDGRSQRRQAGPGRARRGRISTRGRGTRRLGHPCHRRRAEARNAVVVFGDSDFPSNAYGGVPGNVNLFANTINWLAQQENLIAIRPTEAADRRVSMTPRQQTMALITSIFVLPGLVFAAGIFTWWRRR